MALREEMSPEAQNRTWREHVEKEKRSTVLREDYAPNYKKQAFLTDAPNKCLGLPLGHPAYSPTTLTDDDKEVLKKFAEAKQGPQERYHWAQTEAMEVGWSTRPLMEHPKEFFFPNGTCDITQYADTYVKRCNNPNNPNNPNNSNNPNKTLIAA
jgi:hypothetical protein